MSDSKIQFMFHTRDFVFILKYREQNTHTHTYIYIFDTKISNGFITLFVASKYGNVCDAKAFHKGYVTNAIPESDLITETRRAFRRQSSTTSAFSGPPTLLTRSVYSRMMATRANLHKVEIAFILRGRTCTFVLCINATFAMSENISLDMTLI